MRVYQETAKCSGCGACRQSCAQNAISMREDSVGFLFPCIDESKCVNCGLCEKVCPYNNLGSLKNGNLEPKAYALRHKDAETLMESSSGGAFSAIVEAVCPDIVFGACWDENWGVHHVGYAPESGMARLRKSKYIQSNTEDTFRQAKGALQDGKKVLYSGTPCQIAGLRSFLGKDYAKLVTCDLICEGVQSQKFWNAYLDSMRSRYHSEVDEVSFRDKTKRGWERSEFILHFRNGKTYRRISETKDSAYMNSFIFQGGNRDSCYACPYAEIPRQGDFTIGDLWGWREIVPEWSDNKGASVVLCNTMKASSVVEQLRRIAQMREIPLLDAVRQNPNIMKCTAVPKQRELYMKDMETLPFEQLEKKWLKPRSWLRKILSEIKYRLGRIN